MQASGDPHIGNYLGMMQRTVELQDSGEHECLYMIADLHAFTSHPDLEVFRRNQKACVLDWLAIGIDPEKSVFFRQSDVRAHTELTWLLLCHTPMGLLERAHSYKDKTARGLEANAGLFTYPVLMACDILLYDAQVIPVGKDQKQHVEMTRDIAQRFNHQYGEIFVLPEPSIEEEVQTIPGLDGAKMSKSYGNTINLFDEEAVMRKKIMSMKTDSKALGEALDPDTCPVFAFHRLFENPNLDDLAARYREGAIGYGDSKKELFEVVWEFFRPMRERREKLLADPGYLDAVMQKGARRANEQAEKKLSQVRQALGLSARHAV